MELGGLYKTVIEKNIPLFACFEIISACNNRCSHCYIAGDHILSFDEITRCMDDAAELGTLFLSITGGEPLLHEDIWEILAYAVDKHFATLLYTNATLIGRPEAIRLKELGVYHVDTSLLGANARTHDALTKIEGSFEKTMQALKELGRQGISMVAKTPVMKENADEIDELKGVLENMGVDHIASPLIFARDDGDTGPLSHRLDDFQLSRFFSAHQVECLEDRHGSYSCHFGKCTFAVRANGDVNPCISVPVSLGNIRESSLKQIWETSPQLEYIRKKSNEPLAGCRDCNLAGWCFRCEGISFTEEGKLYEPSDELCRMARIRKEIDHERCEKAG